MVFALFLLVSLVVPFAFIEKIEGASSDVWSILPDQRPLSLLCSLSVMILYRKGGRHSLQIGGLSLLCSRSVLILYGKRALPQDLRLLSF